jgi:S1-C subfamily serine protease
MKQFKPERESSEYTNGSDHHNGMDTSLDTEEPIPLTRATTTADTAEWQATVESVIKNVVSIHFCQTCSFDTDAALSSEATGFVVDAEKGYILTNRVSLDLHLSFCLWGPNCNFRKLNIWLENTPVRTVC